MASIVAAFDAMENEGIVGNAAIIGREMLVPGFTPLQAKHPMTGEIRGEGFFLARSGMGDEPAQRIVGAVDLEQIRRDDLGLLGQYRHIGSGIWAGSG